jgi:hypothetical protein
MAFPRFADHQFVPPWHALHLSRQVLVHERDRHAALADTTVIIAS